jgi:hypothetical protein
LESLDVKLQVPGVGSKPFPLAIPTPVIFRKVELCEIMTHEVRSNLKPATLHKFGVLVEGLKIHGAAIATLVPGEMLEKSPESCSTNELFQRFTLAADVSDVVFVPVLSPNVTTPPKSMLPTIGLARREGAKLPTATRNATVATARVFMLPRSRFLAKFVSCPCAAGQSRFANAETSDRNVSFAGGVQAGKRPALAIPRSFHSPEQTCSAV